MLTRSRTRLLAAFALASVITAVALVAHPLGGTGRSESALAAEPELVESLGAVSLGGGPTVTDADLQLLQAAVASRPRDSVALDALGAAYLQRMRDTYDFSYLTRASEAFSRALAAHHEDFAALLGLGSLAGTQHRFAESVAYARRAAAVSVDSPKVQGELADAFVQLGAYQQAWAATQRMVDLRPDLASYSRVSAARFLRGHVAGAVRSMELAVASGGSAIENTEWARAQLGQLLFKEGRLAQAAAVYRHALVDYPGYHRALAGLAQVDAAQGRTRAAERLLSEAVDRVPAPDYLALLGDVEAASGDHLRAAQQYALVRVEQRLFRANGGVPDLELALFDVTHGHAARALAGARSAYATRPSIQAAETLGLALARTGDCAAGLPYARLSLRLGTQDPPQLYHAAVVEACAGQRAAALRHVRLALRLNPAFSPLEAPQAVALVHRLERSR
jgi:tetratricopeptide (TPR) repeat protein